MPEPMIEVRDVHKKFRRPSIRMLLRSNSISAHTVLRGVDLSVSEGDFVALLGANGAGKTTMLKSIATLLLPDSGTISVLGRDVTKEPGRVRREVGYVLADDRSFHWRLTASENLDFFARLEGISPAEGRTRVAFLLERLDLQSSAARPFGEFSTGMKQRLAVARALLKRPRVLLMDEPTRSIDPAHAADIWRLVREEVDGVKGCLVLVTHQIQEALSLCTRVAILADGQIVLDTTASSMERFATDLDGFTISVRGLRQGGIERLRMVQGVRDVQIASQTAGEQVLEVTTGVGGELPLGGFIQEVTGLGATICSLQRATPLQGVVERLLSQSNGRPA
ncbi:MAG: ABC transporter ATP-binding protein [Dehalococcoidia bacterium]